MYLEKEVVTSCASNGVNTASPASQGGHDENEKRSRLQAKECTTKARTTQLASLGGHNRNANNLSC